MTLLLGERYRAALEEGLRKYGQDFHWLPDNPHVDPPLAGHADLSVFMPDRYTLIAAEGVYDHIVNYLTNNHKPIDRSIHVYRGTKQNWRYPSDAGLCVCHTGKYTLYNPKTIDPVARNHLTGHLIEVTQGYTKCSVCVVSEDAIITSDAVIRSRAVEAGMDVLLISPGDIDLAGFNYGFIGGASFLLDEHHLAFTGHLDSHPDQAEIMEFLAKHGITPVFLTGKPAFDIGGAIRL